MNYQEAIYCMKVMADEEVCEDCNYYQLCDHTKQADMARIAISAMQELMKYKKFGTLEDLMKLKERELSGVELAKISCSLNHLEKYKQLGALEEVREAVETVKRYETQYLDNINNPLEPLKISSALKSEIMKLELRKQSKPESISVLDYTIIAALQKVLYEVCGEEE